MSGAPVRSVPTLVSLLICDQVIDDRLTNKKSAIGLFNAILVPRFPATIQQLVVMASITEIQGEAGIELRLIRDTDNSVLFRAEERVRAPSPLATVDMVFALRGVGIPVAGNYAIELLSASALLGRRRFQVIQQGQRPVQGERPDSPPDASDN
ncbi:MAG: hypothetical protein JXO22_16915 [Phycisphaerae bacterium]|nr:hypothetical protein [Phycisphaerae bacterium]